MNKIHLTISSIDKIICSNISVFDESERGLLSQNILSQLRNLVEYTSLKAYSVHLGRNVEDSYENITLANQHISARVDLRFCQAPLFVDSESR